jgi:hypothetical protein
LQRDLGENLTGTISTGYTHINAERDYELARFGDAYDYAGLLNFIPAKAGIRIRAGKAFFIAGDMGEVFGQIQTPIKNRSANMPDVKLLSEDILSRFIYSLSAGFSWKSGIETGINFEDYGLSSQ